MAHYATLGNFMFAEAAEADDVRGAKIYGRDGDKLGQIEDVVFDHDTGEIRYVVIDTGGWLNSRKFLVPAARVVQRVEKGRGRDDEFAVDMTRKDIERLPVFDERHLQDERRWRQHEGEYRVHSRAMGWSEEGDVIHQEGTTRILTPDPNQIPANAPHIAPGDHVEGLHPNLLEHREVGMMNTSPTATGQRQENERLTLTSTDAPRPAGSGGAGADLNTSVAESIESRKEAARDHSDELRNDAMPQCPAGSESMASGVVTWKAQHGREMEENNPVAADINAHTLEGDSIFSAEDLRHQHHQAVLDRDIPGYRKPRPVHAEAGQSAEKRWDRFGTHLRSHLHEIRGTCDVCNAGTKGDKESAA